MSALAELPAVAEVSRADGTDLPSLVATGLPHVIRGLIADWPAVAAGRTAPAALIDYLRGFDAGLPGPVMEAPAASEGRFGYASDPREFTFTRRQRPLAETFARILRALERPGSGIIAAQMVPLASHLPGFAAANRVVALEKVAPLLWLGGPVRTQIHNDRDHNLACVVAGRRRFLLFPPAQVANLYIGPPDNPPPLSLVDPEAPDLARFPCFADALATASIAELAPGDALVLPRYWWHHVTSRDPFNAMVNYWWGDRATGLAEPNAAFLAALLALKPLSPTDRAYWQAMFATHVFADHGSDHLPAAARGMLGALGPAALDRLHQRLRADALKTS